MRTLNELINIKKIGNAEKIELKINDSKIQIKYLLDT